MNTKILKPLPLYIRGYEKIKNYIITGILSPGQRLTDHQLAEMLGISRTPVREAVKMLCREGLLLGEDGTVTVYKPTLRELGEVYAIRAVVEGLAISNIITRGKHQDIADELDRIVEQSNEAVREGHHIKVTECNTRLHNLIIEASDNKILIKEMESINSKKEIYRRISLTQDRHVHISIEEHRQLAKCLRSGDMLANRNLLEKHILQAGFRLFKEMLISKQLIGEDAEMIGNYLETMQSMYDNATIGQE